MNVKQLKLLIIDDEEILSMMLKEYLEDMNMYVVTAECGKEGLDALAAESFDAVIVDMRLPDMDGDDFIKTASATYSGIEFFIHTGSHDYKLPDELVKLGMTTDSIFFKPISDMDIIYQRIMHSNS